MGSARRTGKPQAKQADERGEGRNRQQRGESFAGVAGQRGEEGAGEDAGAGLRTVRQPRAGGQPPGRTSPAAAGGRAPRRLPGIPEPSRGRPRRPRSPAIHRAWRRVQPHTGCAGRRRSGRAAQRARTTGSRSRSGPPRDRRHGRRGRREGANPRRRSRPARSRWCELRGLAPAGGAAPSSTSIRRRRCSIPGSSLAKVTLPTPGSAASCRRISSRADRIRAVCRVVPGRIHVRVSAILGRQEADQTALGRRPTGAATKRAASRTSVATIGTGHGQGDLKHDDERPQPTETQS